jgi:hypothetical protein
MKRSPVERRGFSHEKGHPVSEVPFTQSNRARTATAEASIGGTRHPIARR